MLVRRQLRKVPRSHCNPPGHRSQSKPDQGYPFHPIPKKCEGSTETDRQDGSRKKIHFQALRQSHAFFETLKKPKDFEWTKKCESALEELETYLTTPPLLSKPLHDEVLLLYLAVSEHAVSAVLVREEGTKQLPIYYVSKALLDAKTHFSHLERLALALMIAARKLRPYSQGHPIGVVTSFPIKLVLHKPEVSGRLAKLALELG